MKDDDVLAYFRDNGWTLSAAEATNAGVRWEDLYRLRDEERLVEISRGVFRHADAPAVEHIDFVAVAKRAPRAVICLSSALAYWDLTDDIPNRVHLAVARGTHRPRIDWPPTTSHEFATSTFTLGVTDAQLPTGEGFRIHSRERALADAMRLGKRAAADDDVTLVRNYLRHPSSEPTELLDIARKLRCGRRMGDLLRVLLT